MARQTFNVRQISITGSKKAMSDLTTVSKDAVFMMQKTGSSSEVQLVTAASMQDYFSDVDIESASGANELTLIFASASADEPDAPGSHTLYKDSEGTSAIGWTPSSNLLKIVGDIRLAHDGAYIDWGNDQDLKLSHVVGSPHKLRLSGSSAPGFIQFGAAGVEVGSSGPSQLDIDGPTVQIAASTLLDIDGGAIDIDGTTVNVSGSGAHTYHGASTATLDYVGAISIDSNAGLTLGGSSLTMAADGGVADLDATGVVSVNSSAAAINIGDDEVAAKIKVGGDTDTRTEVELNAILLDLNAGTGGLLMNAGAASELNTTSGDITINAAGSSNKVVIKGDNSSSGTAIHLDGDAGSSAVVKIDAGVLDMNASGATTIDSTSGAISLTGVGINLNGGSSEIDVTTTGNLDINAGAIDISGSSTLNMDAQGAITIGTSIADTVTIGQSTSDTFIKGNLYVEGTTTQIDTTNLLVEDPLIILAVSQSSSPSVDQGFIFERGSSTNSAFIWDESADVFSLVSTSTTGSTAGDVSITDYLDLRLGALTVEDAASVGGATTLSSTLSVAGRADFDGVVDMASTLHVTGAITADSTFQVDGAATLSSTLNVVGRSDLDGAVDMASTLHVTGAITADSTFQVDGVATLSNNATVGGTLDVTGATTLNGAVTVGDASGDNLIVNSEDVDFANTPTIANTALTASGADALYVRDESAGQMKELSFSELGQYLVRGTSDTAGDSNGIMVSSAGVLSLDMREEFFKSGSTNSGSIFSMALASTAIVDNSLAIYLNGQLQLNAGDDPFSENGDYSVSGATVTFVQAIDDTDVITVRYTKK